MKLGSSGARVLKWPVSRKRLVVERNGVKIWNSWTMVTHIWGTFDPVEFKVILVHSVYLSQMSISQPRLVVERNGVKFETRGQKLYIYGVHLSL